jgi:excisionase family DNA binding protein
MTVEESYRQYVEQTKSAEAAALLVLADLRREVMTPPQVAELLGVAPETVISWIRSRMLKASNLATGTRPSYRVTRAALDDFLDSRAL